jgi:glucose/arabinose dehydrogenase
VQGDGTLRPAPFLDISDRVNAKTYPEAGLLALAFDPHYASNGRFYVYYTGPGAAGGDVLHLSRFQVSADPDVAALAETSVLTVAHPGHYNHTGAQLEFGVDGDLYIGLGDGGLVDEDDDPGVNAQDRHTLLGKLLRLDVSGAATYTVPASNPFTQTAGARPEIWSLGLRNPWRFSFDRLTHDLYIADVGQFTWEEVDFAPHDSPGGENYGWDCYEGDHVYTPAACTPAGTIFPVAEYEHTQANASIIGGYVYRGSAYPLMQGAYLFADYINGEFWRMDSATHAVTPLGPLMEHPVSFGESPAGELYVTSISAGTIARLAAVSTPYHAELPLMSQP